MHAIFKKGLVSVLCSVPAILLYAQDLGKYEIGISGGIFIYGGDLTPSRPGSYRTPAFHVGIAGSRVLTKVFSARAQLTYGGLRGDDGAYNKPEWRQQRNFSFTARTLELSGAVLWYPAGASSRLHPYLTGGVSVGYFRITPDASRFNHEYFNTEPQIVEGLARDAAHGTPAFIAAVPVGVGVRYRLSERVLLTAESSYRFLRSDYLDGFSEAVNPSKNDQYHSHALGVAYRLGKRKDIDCPDRVKAVKY